MPIPSFHLYANFAYETARISVPAVVGAKRGTLTTAYCDDMLRDWATRLLRRVHATLDVSGVEHIQPDTSYVVMSNHQSHYDIPTLFSSLPLSIRMVAKAELFKAPLWGAAMTAAHFVEIDRSNRKAAYKALRHGGQLMREHGISLYIAPEGTRSLDGTVGTFKRGGFEVARATRAPILPVAISGTRDILAKNRHVIHSHKTVRVRILPPIDTPDFSDADALRSDVRQQIVDAIAGI